MVIFVYKPNNKKSLQLLEKSKNYFYRLRVLFIISSMSAIEDITFSLIKNPIA